MSVTVLAAVGPVMNQQPTVFDLIQNDPDLSEVSYYFTGFTGLITIRILLLLMLR